MPRNYTPPPDDSEPLDAAPSDEVAAEAPAAPVRALPFLGMGNDGAAPVLARPTPPVLLAFSPVRWDVYTVDGEARVLPALRTIRPRPGTNGITQRRNGKIDLSGLRENLAEAGWTLLDPRNYNRPSAIVADSWVPAWAQELEDGTVIEDPAAYASYVAGLVDRGVVRGPSPIDRKRLDAKLRQLDAGMAKQHGKDRERGQIAEKLAAVAA